MALKHASSPGTRAFTPHKCTRLALKPVAALQQPNAPHQPNKSGNAQSTGKRQLLAGTLASLACLTLNPQNALADAAPSAAAADVPTVYFGNGCFWGRQHDFYETEKALGRADEDLSAVVGYAGGTSAGPGDKVCYYLADPRTVYEKLVSLSVRVCPANGTRLNEWPGVHCTLLLPCMRCTAQDNILQSAPRPAALNLNILSANLLYCRP